MTDETTRTQEMGDLPIGYSAKIGRAKQHLQSLKASTESFVDDGKAYSVVKEADRNAGKYSFRLKVERDPPVIEWSLMIGDCLHNARTSLDHLFWALVNKRHPDGFTGKTSNLNFPILKDASTFKGREINLKNAVGDAVFE